MTAVVKDQPDVLEHEVAPTLSVSAASFDTQVATAKRFPRSIARFMQHAQEMATLTPDIAASCVYAIPRDGKMIEGPSARLAEIVAHAWGNLRIQASASESDDRFIIGRGEAWDVETNVAIGYEVRRRISSKGKTYSDDMIAVTGNAAASIALRNAVFKAVPSSFWKPIYFKCREVIAGKAETFHKRRDEMMKAFGVMGVTPDQITGLLQVRGVLDITLEHMVTLTGVYNSLKDGETTIEESFPASAIKTPERKSEHTKAATAPESSQAPEPSNAETAPVVKADPPKHIGVIVKVEPVSGGAFVHLDTGFACSTRDEKHITHARELRDDAARVELVTKAPSDSKYAPVLVEIKELPAQP